MAKKKVVKKRAARANVYNYGTTAQRTKLLKTSAKHVNKKLKKRR